MGKLGCKLLNEYGFLGTNTGFECLVVFLWFNHGNPNALPWREQVLTHSCFFGVACVRLVS